MENEIIILSLSYLYLKRKRDECEKKTNKRSVWVNDWLLKRKEKGCTENLLKERTLFLFFCEFDFVCVCVCVVISPSSEFNASSSMFETLLNKI